MKSLWALLLAGLASPLLAQGLPEPPWYQVELIIFRYLETSSETESWPALPELAYPGQLRHLNSGATDSNLRRNFHLRRIEDSVPAPVFDLAWDKSVAELLRAYEDSLDPLGAGGPLPVLEGVADENAEASDATAAIIDALSLSVPRAFTALDPDAAEFAEQALRIRRSRDMRLLFHQRWLQPMRARERSLPIAVDGVITQGDYPALQGSLLLYVSRYLHIETDLWLNTRTAVENEAAESATPSPTRSWTMPPPPLPPKAFVGTPWSFQVELDAGFSDGIELARESALHSGQAATLENAAGDARLPIVAASGPAEVLQPVQIRARRIVAPDIEQILQQPLYPFDHAILVRQTRRMRGGELHYLDHPLLGIIVRVSRYEFEPFLPPQDVSVGVAENSRGSGR